MDDWLEFKGKVLIENLWPDDRGIRWCFFFVDGKPWLSCEADA